MYGKASTVRWLAAQGGTKDVFFSQAAVQMCIMASLKGVPAAGSFLADFSSALRRAVKLEGVLLNPAPPGGDPCGAPLWWYAPFRATGHLVCNLVFPWADDCSFQSPSACAASLRPVELGGT